MTPKPRATVGRPWRPGKALERAILRQAKSIQEKYVRPPVTTEFAVMFLPSEGPLRRGAADAGGLPSAFSATSA